MPTKAELEKLRSKGTSKISLGLFRWSKDWDAAAQKFEEAAQGFKNIGENVEAYATFLMAAEAQAESGYPISAGTNYEKAGLVAKDLGHPAKIVEAYEKAAQMFALENNTEREVQALSSAGKALSSLDEQFSIDFYRKALDTCITKDHEYLSRELLNQLVSVEIREKRYQECCEDIEKYLCIFDVQSQPHNLHRFMLCVIVLKLHLDRVSEAHYKFDQFEEKYPDFDCTEAGFAATELLEVYDGGDPEQLSTIRSRHPIISEIHTSIANVARKLNFRSHPGRRAKHGEDEESDGLVENPYTSGDVSALDAVTQRVRQSTEALSSHGEVDRIPSDSQNVDLISPTYEDDVLDDYDLT